MRNQVLGYWNYGKNLKTEPRDFIDKYCTTAEANTDFSMEMLHNIYHNNQGFILSSADYSICNPVFIAYHGFIDFLL